MMDTTATSHAAPRRATPAEAPAIAALVARAYGPWVPVLGRRPAPMDDEYAAIVAAGHAWLLGEPGAPVALVVLRPAADHLWLDNIAVDPARQGEGLGRALLAFAEAEARRLRLPEIRLLTNQRMASNIALYARHGFVETSRATTDGLARVYMARRLAPGG
jgi:GNAT superfamily N-acetyltransferase